MYFCGINNIENLLREKSMSKKEPQFPPFIKIWILLQVAVLIYILLGGMLFWGHKLLFSTQQSPHTHTQKETALPAISQPAPEVYPQ
jgi:hypothetical protein